MALEWFNKQSHTWVDQHAKDVKRRLEKNIFPLLGKRPIDQINAPELLDAVRKIEDRGAHDLAHRVLQVCVQEFHYGIATAAVHAIFPLIYAAHLLRIKKHQAAIRSEELTDLLRAIATYHEIGDKQTRLVMQLLATKHAMS